MTVESRITEGTPLLFEREEELAGVTAALERAGDGEGSLLVIAGSAGTGKSALVTAAVERARERGLATRRGRGSELEQKLSFGVIRQLFEAPVRLALAAGRTGIFAGAAAAAARLFADTPVDAAGGADGGFAVLHGLYWLAVGLAAQQPLLLAVDDAHWADAPSVRALDYLAGRIADVPIVLVAALRPREPSGVEGLLARLESQPTAQRLELSALRPGAVAEIVRTEIREADDGLCAAFHDASAGNPFYLRELLRSVAPENGTAPAVGCVREAAVTSVGDRVMRRVAALGPHAPRLASAMSVLGSTGRLRDAAAVAGLPERDAAEAALGMRRVEILAADDPFEWIHPLVRRSIYDNLTVTEREALHARAAEILSEAGGPAGVVATHLSALRPEGSPRVVAGLLAAADEALARDAPDVAVTLLRRAVDEQADDPPRVTLLLKLGQVEVMRRDPMAAGILREVRELTRDPRERTLAALSLAESLTFDGQWDASAATIAAAIDELGDSDPGLTLELETMRAVICAFDPTLAAAAWRDRDRLLGMSRAAAWPARALSALLALTSALRGEHLEDVVPLCAHAAADGVLLGERGAGTWAASHVLAALVTIEEYGRALAFSDELSAAARAQGSVGNALVADGYRGWIAIRRGDLAAGEEILAPVAQTALENDMLLVLVTMLWWMSDVLVERTSQPELVGLVESLEVPPAFADAAGGGWVLTTRGRLRAMHGARAEAEQDLRAAGRIFGRLGFGPLHETWRSALALALPASGADEARALVDEELSLARAAGVARPQGIALRASGLLAGGGDGIEILRESATVLSGSPSRHEHARSLVELGAALRRSGRRSDAREPLEAGMELAHLCGAERLVGRAHDELLAAGARPRRIVRSGFAALTASERRTVRLAAEGRSNPEIAQVLFVSLKTVETHLGNAYRKLDLSGAGARKGLAGHVEAAEATGSV